MVGGCLVMVGVFVVVLGWLYGPAWLLSLMVLVHILEWLGLHLILIDSSHKVMLMDPSCLINTYLSFLSGHD